MTSKTDLVLACLDQVVPVDVCCWLQGSNWSILGGLAHFWAAGLLRRRNAYHLECLGAPPYNTEDIMFGRGQITHSKHTGWQHTNASAALVGGTASCEPMQQHAQSKPGHSESQLGIEDIIMFGSPISLKPAGHLLMQ